MIICITVSSLIFFFMATTPSEIYTLSLHDALPIYFGAAGTSGGVMQSLSPTAGSYTTKTIIASGSAVVNDTVLRSEEHTSELQSHSDLVCRLLLEKKKIHQPETPCDRRMRRANCL